jgi:hypothetical protein
MKKSADPGGRLARLACAVEPALCRADRDMAVVGYIKIYCIFP